MYVTLSCLVKFLPPEKSQTILLLKRPLFCFVFSSAKLAGYQLFSLSLLDHQLTIEALR